MKRSFAPGEDILRELTNAELLDLIELYKRKGDRYHCMLMYNQYLWNKRINHNSNAQWKPLQKTYYTHRHSNFVTNGTYISLLWDTTIFSIQFHTFEESLKELKECFIKTNLIDWKSGPIFTAINIDCVDEIVHLVEALGGAIAEETPCTCFTLAHSNALNIQVPSVPAGYELRPLQHRHADFIYETWLYKSEASVDFLRGMIEFNITLGIFRLRDNELVACIFQNESYGIGLLQVIPEERGKGYATLLVKAISKEIAKCSTNDIPTFVVVGNVKSECVFTKVGYKKHCITKWVHFKKLSKL